MLGSYLICAGARTGSNLLATALRQVDVAGKPFEYFNTGVMNAPFMLGLLGLEAGNANPPDRLDRVVRAGTTPNGIFGATVHWVDLERLLVAVGEKQGRTLPALGHAPDGLRSYFPRLLYVWLRRENKVAQAISHYLAVKTGRWFEMSRDPAPDRRQESDVPFDFDAIKNLVTFAANQEAAWRQFLAGSTDTTLALTYEELDADYAGTIGRVLRFLGVADTAIRQPPFRRQRDERSLEWERRYRAL